MPGNCGGPLWEIDGPFRRFRCHTGHAFTGRHLVDGLAGQEETSLWAALRVVEERVRMLHRMAQQDRERGKEKSWAYYHAKAEESEEHVRALRKLLRA